MGEEGEIEGGLLDKVRKGQERNKKRQEIQMRLSLIELTLNKLERSMAERDLNGPEQSEYNQAVEQARELNQQLANL